MLLIHVVKEQVTISSTLIWLRTGLNEGLLWNRG